MALAMLNKWQRFVNQRMQHSQNQFSAAFTLTELLLIFAVLFLLASAFLAARPRRACGCQRINCTNNLKQIGLAYRTFALDNNDRYPAQVPVASGGSQELAVSGGAFVTFRVMSNELSTPKILLCPQESDSRRIVATTFNPGPFPPSAQQVPFASDLNVSYFASLDAQEQYSSMWLGGDRQMSIDARPPGAGLVVLLTNSVVRWVKAPHEKKGNLLMADGSVIQPARAELQNSVAKSDLTINRLAMP